MTRLLLFAAFTVVSTGLASLLNLAEGIGLQPWQQLTWGLGMFTGLLIGSAAERAWPRSSAKRQRP